MSRIVLAMSGGVDSSVAAHLLLDAGHDVIGVFMRHGGIAPVPCSSDVAADGRLPIVKSGHKQGCCSASDADDARRVADQLDIPLYALNFQDEFAQIVDYFIEEYRAARTPNPCVVCNTWLKFGKLFEYADDVGAEFVATGHYARLVPRADGPALCRGLDDHKDQSYVLFGIDRRLLGRMMLPVGDYRKEQIREFARGLQWRVADKRDSQEICFVPEGDHAAFIRERRGESATAGEIVTTDGRLVGHHDGLERFTIGQRKGLGVALGEPRFVVRLESDTHRVVIGTKQELARDRLTAKDANWLASGLPPTLRCHVKIRYNSERVPALVETLGARRMSVLFDEAQYGVAPGQAVVCYDDDRVLGGGWIE